MKADRAHIEKRFFAGASVQGFNVAKRVRKVIARHADFVGGQAVKHERVIGIGTMRDGDFGHIGRGGCFSMVGVHGGAGPFK